MRCKRAVQRPLPFRQACGPLRPGAAVTLHLRASPFPERTAPDRLAIFLKDKRRGAWQAVSF